MGRYLWGLVTRVVTRSGCLLLSTGLTKAAAHSDYGCSISQLVESVVLDAIMSGPEEKHKKGVGLAVTCYISKVALTAMAV